MDASTLNTVNEESRLRVSIIARLMTALAYTIPAIGAALGSLLLIRVFQALKTNESAGVTAVMAGVKEADLPVNVSLYLAAICGIVVIIVLVVRMIVQTKTASPPFWFFAVGGILCFVPAGLFWKAEMLIIDAISPGSSIGGAGIATVGADIARLLSVSVITALIVFIILLVASVLPLTSRQGKKWGSLAVSAVIEIALIATVIAVPFLIGGPKRTNEIVNLPVNVKYADHDNGVEKDTSMVITLTADNKMYLTQIRELPGKRERTETVITKEELPAKIKYLMEGKTPDKRFIYFKCDVNASYENVLPVFDIIRKSEIEKVALVVVGEKNVDDPYQVAAMIFQVRLQEPFDKNVITKPNPLMLVAALDKDGKLKLNNEEYGVVSDSERLVNKLRGVFKDRENNGFFREGTNEVEKTVFLKASGSVKYGDFIKLVEGIKRSGAEPIVIQIDDIKPVEATIDLKKK